MVLVLLGGIFAAARDRLSDLTSREGDWFMDELCTMSGNVTQMTNTLKFCISVSWSGIIAVSDTVSHCIVYGVRY